MTIEKAKKIAIEYLNASELVIVNTKHTEAFFVFFFDYPDAEIPTPSSPVILVDKMNGEATNLILPSKEGFSVLRRAVPYR